MLFSGVPCRIAQALAREFHISRGEYEYVVQAGHVLLMNESKEIQVLYAAPTF